jgi:hypothetical protein
MEKTLQGADTSVTDTQRGSEPDYTVLSGEKQGTLRDVEQMKRLGKDQLFKACGLLVRARPTDLRCSVILASLPYSALP